MHQKPTTSEVSILPQSDCPSWVVRLCFVATLFVSVRLPGLGLLTVGVLPALLILRWTTSVARPHRRLLTLAGAALISGSILLAFLEPPVGTPGPLYSSLAIALWMLTLPALGFAVCLALSTSSRPALLLSLSIAGGIASELFDEGVTSNLWKYSVGYGICALALLLLRPKKIISIVVIVAVLSIVCVRNESRSIILMLIASALSVILLRVVANVSRRTRTLLIGGSGLVAAIVLVWAMSSGALGGDLQRRYDQQAGTAGNVIAGGRVETQAARALVEQRWYGYGLGAEASGSTRRYAVEAVEASGGDYTSPYFRSVILGERADLHSGISNLWFHGGFGGIALFVGLAWVIILGLTSSARYVASSVGLAFLMWFGLWDLLFSPIQISDHVSLALGIALWLGSPRSVDEPGRAMSIG